MTARRPRRVTTLLMLPVALLLCGLAALAGATAPAQAVVPVPTRAAADGWVDGADEFPCLDDVTCLWIENCELDENQHPIYPNRNGTTSYPAGTYSYADEHEEPTTPTPTTPTPTTPTTPTPGGNGGNGGGTTTPTPGTTTPTPGTTTPTPGTPTPGADTGLVPTDGTTAPVVPPGAPSALAAPTLTVKGKTVTVSWVASPNAELEQVTGYLVRFTGVEAVATDATTFTYEFADLEPGSYRAAVWAVNAAGEGAGSPPSEPVVVGADPTKVKGTVTVTGDVVPGATVTLTGTGFAPRIEGFALELHSDPVPLGTVNSDDNGGFTSQVVVPASVAPGDHEVVVLFEGKQVSASPVTVLAAAGAAQVAEASADVADTGEAAADPVPDQAGLVILGALGAAGAIALLWRGLRGRRRPNVTVSAPAVAVQ
jgi:hypothetical protein